MMLLLKRMLDESEFLSDYGVRALSRYHRDHPYIFHWNGSDMRVDYEPVESTSGLFGVNACWAGSILFPMNFLRMNSLDPCNPYNGFHFRGACQTGSGIVLSTNVMASES